MVWPPRILAFATCTLFCLVVVPQLIAANADVIPHRQDKPPNRPYSPQEALERMKVPDGFVVELVASEPDIVNPVAMTFDDCGRIWITESVEYPRQSAGEGRDRVKILQDTTGDGRADKITVFAEGLNIPSAIAVGFGGVWVVNAPDLLFMEEENGRETNRKVVLTGFGRTDTHELPNSLTWGPDGWLYGLNGVFNHCHIVSAGNEFKFNCALFRVHPRTHEFDLFCEGTSNPWGLAWDPDGSAIVSTCHWANDHVFHFVESGYYQRQAGPYPPYTMKIGSISDHGHQKTAYCGFAYFDSSAYPPQYRGRFYTGNIHGGCINVDVLRRDGSTYVASAEPDFLTANDAWFMPVAQTVGPDGCLYILDWYDRYHCSQDARRDPAGVDRGKGRLYRVRYEGTPRPREFDLAVESDEELIRRLASDNIFFRQRAQRLLTERGTAPIRARLRLHVQDGSASRTQRLHGLWALIGTGSLEPDFHEQLLHNPDATFRAWGVRAAGNFRLVAPSIRDKVSAMAADSAPEVQLQVAIAAAKIEGLQPLPILVSVLQNCGHDKLIPSIVWPNLHPLLESQAEDFVSRIHRSDLLQSPALASILPMAMDRILGGQNPHMGTALDLLRLSQCNLDAAKRCMSVVARKSDELHESDRDELRRRLSPLLKQLVSAGPSNGLYFSAQLLAAHFKLEVEGFDSVRQTLVSADQPDALRLEALSALIAADDSKLVDLIARMLKSESTRFLLRFIPALGRLSDTKVADVVLRHYQQIDPEVQPLAINLLMQREPWVRRMLDAIRRNELPRAVLDANHLRKILESNDREAIWTVEELWGMVRRERNPRQEHIVEQMREMLRVNDGDPAAGEAAFRKLCAQCHVIYGQGQEVGPDLTTNGRASFDQILSNVFDPSLVVGSAYQVTTVVTRDGRNLTGIVAEDNDERIVLTMQGARQETIPRHNVKYVRVSKLSMMPEGIENIYGRQELADLFAFLCLDKHPSDPDARPIPGATLRAAHRHD